MDLDVPQAVPSGHVHGELPPGVKAREEDVVGAEGRPRELVQEDDPRLLDVLGELRVVEHRAALHEAVHPEEARDRVQHRSHVVDVHLHAELLTCKAYEFCFARSGGTGDHARCPGDDVPYEEIPVGLPDEEAVPVDVGDTVAPVLADLLQEGEFLRGRRGPLSGEEGLGGFLLGLLLVLRVGVQHLPGGGRQVEVVVGVPLEDGVDVPGAVVGGPGAGAQLAHRRAEHRPYGVGLTELHPPGGHLGVELLDDGRPVGGGLERERVETVAGAVPDGLEEIVFHGMRELCPAGCFNFADGF